MKLRKATTLLLAGSMLAGCAMNVSADVETKHHKIGIGLYADSGKSVEAIKAYIDGISDTIDCEFVYTTLSTYDEATNLTEVQNLISSGCEGLILTADMGTTAIVEECEAAGVYLAGFLCDYNTSMFTAYDEVYGSEYFLGTVCDGWADASPYGADVAASVIENGYKNVGVITFPSWAYPNQAEVDAAFRAVIDEYNATAEEPIQVKDTVELQFSPLEDTYLSENSDIDCLFSVAAGATFVYPVIVAADRTDIAFYTTGFEGTEDVDNFGSNGNGCYKGTLFSQPEAIVYPICLLIDKLNGTTYSDLPEVAERVDCAPMEILSDEDMTALTEKSIYFTANYDDAFIKAEQILDMCASYNPDATYAGLVDCLQTIGTDALR